MDSYSPLPPQGMPSRSMAFTKLSLNPAVPISTRPNSSTQRVIAG